MFCVKYERVSYYQISSDSNIVYNGTVQSVMKTEPKD